MTKIIVATGNENKMKEIRQIIRRDDIQFVSLKDEGLQDIEIVEDGKTFEENAIIKANAIADITKNIVIADDSGLEVDYLDKAPGVYSARYMGEDTPYTIKNNHIIELLKDAKGEERSARFVCVIACVMPDGETFTTRGTIEGQIGYEEKGENGFGYDPYFYIKEWDKTFAEVPLEVKNEISHRSKALKKMKELINEDFSFK